MQQSNWENLRMDNLYKPLCTLDERNRRRRGREKERELIHHLMLFSCSSWNESPTELPKTKQKKINA